MEPTTKSYTSRDSELSSEVEPGKDVSRPA